MNDERQQQLHYIGARTFTAKTISCNLLIKRESLQHVIAGLPSKLLKTWDADDITCMQRMRKTHDFQSDILHGHEPDTCKQGPHEKVAQDFFEKKCIENSATLTLYCEGSLGCFTNNPPLFTLPPTITLCLRAFREHGIFPCRYFGGI